MLTLRQIMEQYGLSKSTARRRVLECFPDLKVEPGRAIQLDGPQASIFADWMKKRGAVHESALNQPEQVASSVDKLVATSGFTAEQVQKLVHDAVQAEQVKRLELEVESLMNQLELSQKHVESLETELERLNKALEREQMKSVGFWNRLGQKLLGSAKSE